MARQPAKGKQKARTYRLKIDAFTPDTLPMARLGEYLAELSEVLGEKSSVHFVDLKPGSTVVEYKVDHEAVPKVAERTLAVRHGDAPRDAIRAYRKINALLLADNGKAVLTEHRSNTPILKFPGRDEAAERFPSVRQHGTIEGEVIRVGGTDETIPVILRTHEDVIPHCYAPKATAKALAARLFEPVRLHGIAKWTREALGFWNLDEFRIETFEVLEDLPLSEALTKLRVVAGNWPKGAYAELEKLRHGPPRKIHGRR